MKIQIVQSEIEEAVRDFIRKQISVKEGMEISMDFTATRGEDGLIAAIDISPAATTTEQVSVGKAVEAPATSEPLAIRSRVTRTPKTDTPVVETETEAGTTVAEDPTETIAAPADDGVEEVEGSAPLKPSIFSGLRRPTNDESAEAAA